MGTSGLLYPFTGGQVTRCMQLETPHTLAGRGEACRFGSNNGSLSLIQDIPAGLCDTAIKAAREL